MIHQDTDIYATLLDTGAVLKHELRQGRRGWIQLVGGAIEVNGSMLNSGDGLSIEKETALTLRANKDNTEFLIFDLP
jgi:redox-sensitive bicupin YhaK (pirin superfamily)